MNDTQPELSLSIASVIAGSLSIVAGFMLYVGLVLAVCGAMAFLAGSFLFGWTRGDWVILRWTGGLLSAIGLAIPAYFFCLAL